MKDGRTTIFFSYAGEDRAWVEWAAWQLRNEGFHVIYQHRDFSPGDSIPGAIDSALRDADFTFIFLSQDFLDSVFCQTEWHAAWMRGVQEKIVHLVSVYIADPSHLLLPPLLNVGNAVNLAGLDEITARETLVTSARRLVGIREKPIGHSFPGATVPTFLSPPPYPGGVRQLRRLPLARNRNFVGREEYLSNLHRDLTSGIHSALTQAAHGMGGVGKTQLANEYSYKHQQEYGVVWWVRAETEATLKADLLALAYKAGFPIRREEETLDAVKQWLEESDRWLLIFDNAEHPDSLRPFLPQSKTGNIIITSRFRSWGDVAQSVRVDVFNREQSIAFLVRRTGISDPQGAGRLAEALGDLPLALAQAAAYLEESGDDFITYLSLFEERQLQLLEEGRLSPNVYPDSVATTWDISLERLGKECPEAVEVLYLAAYLAPDDIPKRLFANVHEILPFSMEDVFSDPLRLNNVWRALRRYSLVEAGPDCFSLHRLIQAAIRHRAPSSQFESYARKALCLVDRSLDYDENNQETWRSSLSLVPHALIVSTYIKSEEDELLVAGMLDRAGSTLWKMSQHEQARVCYEEALNAARRAGDGGLADEGSTWNNLGVLLKEMNLLPDSLEAVDRAVRIGERVLGVQHPKLAIRLSNQGLVLGRMGRYDEAISYFERALEINRKESFSSQDGKEGVARDYSHLGNAYKKQRMWSDAEHCLVEALRIGEETLGAEHYRVAIRLNNLAMLYKEMGAYDKAEPPMRRALAIDRKIYSDGHRDVAWDLKNLGLILMGAGRLDEAEKCFIESLSIFREIQGEEHPDTQAVREYVTELRMSTRLQGTNGAPTNNDDHP